MINYYVTFYRRIIVIEILSPGKKVSIGIRRSMDIVMIKDELTAMELYPNDPALHTPLPAIVIFLVLTVYSLYVANTKYFLMSFI